MKIKYLISCILLSTLLFLLLSMAVQATEYREVKVEEILKQIENGEEVNYTDCRIIGELNISKMKLETVPNPYYYKFVKYGLDKEFTSHVGLSESSSVIESNITIRNSIFEDRVDFSNTLFNGSANFRGTNFNSPVFFRGTNFNSPVFFRGTNFNSSTDFEEANFNSDAYFLGANFNSSADFLSVNFNSSADFLSVNFNSSVDFQGANFNGYADFLGTNFNSSAYFLGANFNSSADFEIASFNSDAKFLHANFNNSADFLSVNFNNSADFMYANFNSSANFLYANFNSSANFLYTNFNSDVNLLDTNFNSSANFWGANFDSSADFSSSNFNSSANFWGTNFNSSAKFAGPETPDNIITDGRSCKIFREFYESETQYEYADTIYYNYRKLCQDDKDLTSPSKWSDFLSWIICGYGVRPLRILYSGLLIVGFFTLLYWQGKGIHRLSDTMEKKAEISFWDALYFSISTFTTLGSADWYPTDSFRKWVTLEGLLGWIMLGIFMATLTSVMIRV